MTGRLGQPPDKRRKRPKDAKRPRDSLGGLWAEAGEKGRQGWRTV